MQVKANFYFGITTVIINVWPLFILYCFTVVTTTTKIRYVFSIITIIVKYLIYWLFDFPTTVTIIIKALYFSNYLIIDYFIITVITKLNETV